MRVGFVAFFSIYLGLLSPLYAKDDYSALLKVDLSDELPTMEDLEKLAENDDDYDWKYDYHWNIGSAFDKVLKKTISTYGSSDVRVKKALEDELEIVLKSIPESHYQYVGPYLHQVPGIPEKILNMPGIKETKNKFPTRIAKELEDIEDLEFLSPYLYYVLMPEAWPSYYETIEQPMPVKVKRQKPTKYNPSFFAKIRQLVPAENYYSGAKVELPLSSKLRSLEVTATSPLSMADAKAFTATLDDVKAWGAKSDHFLKIMQTGFLLEAWEAKEGRELPVAQFRSIVNPCQRLVQKIKIAKLDKEFLKVVSKKGFTPDSWAYTCDKTIKAYRVANVHPAYLATISAYVRGDYDELFEAYDPKTKAIQHSLMQAIVLMHQAPMHDVMEIKNENESFYRDFLKVRKSIIDVPIIVKH
ncbi:MAG: hypothetical protein PHE89_05330 [Alphaproteobacteria bacterium]|nr:hypothetical protein [Alphaproteobacteria bacterium]